MHPQDRHSYQTLGAITFSIMLMLPSVSKWYSAAISCIFGLNTHQTVITPLHKVIMQQVKAVLVLVYNWERRVPGNKTPKMKSEETKALSNLNTAERTSARPAVKSKKTV